MTEPGWVQGERGWKVRYNHGILEIQALWGAVYAMPAPPPHSVPRTYYVCDRVLVSAPTFTSASDEEVIEGVGVNWEFCLSYGEPAEGWDPVVVVVSRADGLRIESVPG